MIVVGLDRIGRKAAAHLLRHPELHLVGAADPELAGRPLGELIPGAPQRAIAPSAESLYREAKGGAALICGDLSLDAMAGEIRRSLRAGLHALGSSEELSNLWFADPQLANQLDELASDRDLSILGIGTNPGFFIARLIATLGSLTGSIHSVEAIHRVEVSKVAPPLWQKIALGRTLEEFETASEEGSVGLFGLAESCALVAEGLGLDVDEIEELIDPILAKEPAEVGDLLVGAGQVVGLRQRALGMEEGREIVRLELEIAPGPDEPGTKIRIQGDPPLELSVGAGVDEESAAAWALVNAVPRVVFAEPGLMGVLDLPAS